MIVCGQLESLLCSTHDGTACSMESLHSAEGEHPLAVRMLSGCQQAVNKLSREKICFAQTHFLELTNQDTNIHTKNPQNRNQPNFKWGKKFQIFVRGCQEAVGWLSGKNHRNFEAKIKFGRWFRYHRRAYPTPSVLTPAKFDLHFRLST